MNLELSGILFGLASAASWGAGDFSGGLAAKRSPVYSVVILSQLVGLVLLVALALLLSEPFPTPSDLLWGAAAGLVGGLGLMALYQGLATGRMGVVAPVNAVVSAALPVLFGIWVEGPPAIQQFAGFGLAFVGVWLVSRSSDVDAFLASNDCTRGDIDHWIAHPGGPKVLEAMQAALDLPADALDPTWRTLREVGNLSSTSVLLVLREILGLDPPSGSLGLMTSMGPGFCSELVLLRWP